MRATFCGLPNDIRDAIVVFRVRFRAHLRNCINMVIHVSTLLYLLLNGRNHPIQRILRGLTVILLRDDANKLNIRHGQLNCVKGSVENLIMVMEGPMRASRVRVRRHPRDRHLPFNFKGIFRATQFFRLLGITRRNISLRGTMVSATPRAKVDVTIKDIIRHVRYVRSTSNDGGHRIATLNVAMRGGISTMVKQ